MRKKQEPTNTERYKYSVDDNLSSPALGGSETREANAIRRQTSDIPISAISHWQRSGIGKSKERHGVLMKYIMCSAIDPRTANSNCSYWSCDDDVHW